MDSIRGPFYSGPIIPIGPRHEKDQAALQRLKGKIVGVRPGRSSEARGTRILTIKVLDTSLDGKNLLDSEVEIIVRPHPASPHL